MKRVFSILILTLVLIGVLVPGGAQAQSSPVRLVLFYSPTCGYCHQVITEFIPPIMDQQNSTVSWVYLQSSETGAEDLPPIVGSIGDRLQILYINTATMVGSTLYTNAIDHYAIPDERLGVPTLIINDTVLVGALEIPEQMPVIMEEGFNAGGINWPGIPELDVAIQRLVPMPDSGSESEAENEPTPAPSTGSDPAAPPQTSEQPEGVDFEEIRPSVMDRIMEDPLGNTISIVVLIGLIASFILILYNFFTTKPAKAPLQPGWIIPVIALLGMGVAGYLTFVETTGATAVCGPVGDCNTVNQSEYATLFGLIPVGGLGLFGYIAILAAWMVGRLNLGWFSHLANFGVFGMALFGNVFSIYLTFLEPFVIGATCAWCLSSAIMITLIAWLTWRIGVNAFARFRKELNV